MADARVEEDEGALLAFVVTLSRAAASAFTVDYATADGSAQAGVDYTAATGTLAFQAGESSKTIEVSVLDDAHDEGEETLTLTLSNPSRGRVTDGEATGTIKNRDPLPRALLARFGRTAAVHVVEHVEERLQAPREPGFRGEFAGRELRRGMERDLALSFLNRLGGAAGARPMGVSGRTPMSGRPAGGAASFGTPGLGGNGAGVGMAAAPGSLGGASAGAGAMPGGAAGPGGGLLHGGGLLQMGLGGGDLLTGSAVAMNRETRHGGILSFWSRGAQSSFAGREGALSLGGDVRTTMVGADYARGPLVTGLSLSHSRGRGEYAGVAGGQVASSVTGLYPWLGYQATERVTVWGVAGAAGRLAATEAAVTRFRTGLEGSRAYTLAGRLSLRPSVEVGLRHDGGDAETGAGLDVGGGLVVSDPSTGLAVDLRVRMLVLHQAEGFRERGRGAVGPGDDGRAGARRRRQRHPAGRGAGLRAAGGPPLRRDAHGRRRDVRDGARLPAGLPPRRDRRRGHDGRAGRRCRAPGTPPAGRHGSRRARAGHAALVDGAPSACAASSAWRTGTTSMTRGT